MSNENEVQEKVGFFKRVGTAVRYAVTGSGAWMGPGTPLQPSHQELPPRQYDYPVAINTVLAPASRGRVSGVSYEQLRALADGYDLLRAVIEYRKGQVTGVAWRIMTPGADPAAPETEEERAISDLLKRPTETDTWESWLKKMLEDLLVVDAVALYPIVEGGKLQELRLIDGGTIKKVLNETGTLPEPPEVAYQQIIKGIVMRSLSRDELYLRHANPRTHRMYGFSPVEWALMTINIALRRQVHQLDYYTEGNVPDALATVPDSWTTDEIRTFQAWFDSVLTGSGERRKMRFLPCDASKIKVLDRKDLTDKTDEWFARVISFCFGVDPVFLVSDMNRATAETSHAAAHEAGIMPLLTFVAGLINQVLSDYGVSARFSWDVALEMDTKSLVDYIKVGLFSVDEVRERFGYPPLGVGAMVYTTQGPIPVASFVDAKPISVASAKAPETKGEEIRPFYRRRDVRQYEEGTEQLETREED